MKPLVPNSNKTVTIYALHIPLILLLLALAGGGAYFAQNYEIKLQDRNRLEIRRKGVEDARVREEERNRAMDMDKDTEGYEKVVISESELNSLISQKAVGKGVGDFTLSSAVISLSEGLLSFEAELSDGTEVSGTMAVGGDGRSIAVTDIEVKDGGALASLKEQAIKFAMNQAISQMLEQYGGRFEYVEIGEGEITVYLTRSE